MLVQNQLDPKTLIADKAALRQILDEQDRRSGASARPTMTIEELHQRMVEEGVQPEANIGSREIIRMREEE